MFGHDMLGHDMLGHDMLGQHMTWDKIRGWHAGTSLMPIQIVAFNSRKIKRERVVLNVVVVAVVVDAVVVIVVVVAALKRSFL